MPTLSVADLVHRVRRDPSVTLRKFSPDTTGHGLRIIKRQAVWYFSIFVFEEYQFLLEIFYLHLESSSASRKWKNLNVSNEKTIWILSLHFVPSLQSAVCILYCRTGLVLLFLFERASSPDRNNGARKKILHHLGRYDWCVNCMFKNSRGQAQW